MMTLRRAGAVMSRHRALRLLLYCGVGIVVALVLWMACDVLFHFSETTRMNSLAGFFALTAVAIFVAVGFALFARPPLLRIARVLENRNPALGSKLVNFLQLADAAFGAPVSRPAFPLTMRRSRSGDQRSMSDLTRAMASRAVAQAGDAIDAAALPPLACDPGISRIAIRALAAPALLALITLLGGPHIRNEWLRLFDPSGDHPPFSLTRLVILDPGEKHPGVVYGASFIVQARAQGHVPRELFLTANPLDGKNPAFTLPMISRGDGTFLVPLENIRHDVELTAHSREGSSRSMRRKLRVILTPRIEKTFVRVQPPDYTGQPAREATFSYNGLQVLEGSRVSFRIVSNRPLGEGRVKLTTSVKESLDVPLAPVAGSPAEEAHAGFAATTSAKLSFHIVDIAGNPATSVPTSTFTVTRDLPPAIAIEVPDADAFVVENWKIPVTVNATDDYGLRSVRLHIVVDGKPMEIEPTTFREPDKRSHRMVFPVDLAAMNIRSGAEIVIFAEAIDTRPDPQITRSDTRKMSVITPQQYNDFLRRQSDVAMIAGKYEELREQLDALVKEQRALEEERAALAKQAAQNPGDPALAEKLERSADKQEEVNKRLDELADRMEKFGRNDPVYDFEKELQNKVRQQGEELRDAVAADRAAEQKSAGKAAELADAAHEHRQKLEGEEKQIAANVIAPLEELARLHELMKDFNRFKQITEKQKELMEQSQPYAAKPNPDAQDRLALRSLGDDQRAQAALLEDLAKKLREDAEAARGKFPEAAASADELANAIENLALPELARGAARQMIDGQGPPSHHQARNLHEKMDALFCEQCQNGGQGAESGLDRALRLTRGMSPGNSFNQMMQSLAYRPSDGSGSGAGSGGMMALGATHGMPQLMGGESMIAGPIARAMSGRDGRGGPGSPGGPTARIDHADATDRISESSRRTSTPGSGSLLHQYESIADAYFRRLTAKP